MTPTETALSVGIEMDSATSVMYVEVHNPIHDYIVVLDTDG